MKRILVVDDERQITRVLRAALYSNGYTVLVANSGREALQLFERERPDLIVTDLAMPELDGLELTKAIRQTSEVPILVLSVREGDVMKVAALDAGADDYVTKPFSMPELLARVRAQLRRAPVAAVPETHVEVGDFVIDTDAHSVLVRGEAVHLTPKEFDLLLTLARAPGRVLTHKFLLRTIWGRAGEDQPEYLRVLVAALRKKVERGEGARYIQSEPWVGYRFNPTLQDSEGEPILTTS